MIPELIRMYRIIRQEFGQTLSPLPAGVVIVATQTCARMALYADTVLYSRYREEKIDRPIFIIGNPRSGTTLLQRFLHRSGEVRSFRVWQMFVPSILGQKLLGRVVHSFSSINPARHYASEAHETSFDDVETDEVLLSFRFLDGLFTYLFIGAWSRENELKRLLDSYARKSKKNTRDLKYYEECIKRNLFTAKKKRVLGKPFTFTLRIEDVLDVFPNSKLVYVVRDPADVIASGTNMIFGVTDKQFGTRKLPSKVRQRYFENIYQGECALYHCFYEAYKEGKIPDENIIIVRYADLMSDFENEIRRIMTFCELNVSEKFDKAIVEQSKKQRAHKSKHKYDLREFGLTRERIERDLSFVYEAFDIPKRSPSERGLVKRS